MNVWENSNFHNFFQEAQNDPFYFLIWDTFKDLPNKYDNQCLTTDDSPEEKNVPCVFPFVFDEIMRFECITDTDPDGRYWCFTKVDDNLEGIGNWGYCDQSCPPNNTQFLQEITTVIPITEECPTPNESENKNTPCVFPFAFKGGLISESLSLWLKSPQKGGKNYLEHYPVFLGAK